MPAPLPVGEALQRSVRHVGANMDAAFRLVRPWYGICAAVMVIGLAIGGPISPEAMELTGVQVLALLAGLAARGVAAAAIATAWHRLSFLGEAPSPGTLPPRIWPYLGFSVVIGAAALVAVTFALAVVEVGIVNAGASMAGLWLALLVSLVVGCLAIARLVLVLPATALGTNMPLAAAVQMSDGNTLRIAAAFAVIGLAATLPTMLIASIAVNVGGVVGPLLNILLGLAIELLSVVYTASLLNHLYVWFDGRGPKGDVLSI